MGVDPGLNVTGYAVVEPSPRGPYVLEAGVIRPHGTAQTLGQRLAAIHQGILEVLEQHMPGSFAIEQLHSHVQHPSTAILMAHARGAIVLAAAQRGIPVVSYAATRIKKTLDRQRPGAQGTNPARDQDRAGPGPDPRTARRRRRLRRCAVPLPHQPQSAGVEDGLMGFCEKAIPVFVRYAGLTQNGSVGSFDVSDPNT